MTARRTAVPRLAGLAALALAVPLVLLPAAPVTATGLSGSGIGTGFGHSEDATAEADPIETKLTASDGAHGDLFGHSVAFDGDTALIGAPGADIDGQRDQGAAYVFERDGDTWVQQQKLIADDGASLHEFGLDVALAGDTAVVGSRTANAVYVFVRQDGQWIQQARLSRAVGVPNDYFGAHVALSADGNTVVIGADGEDVNGLTNHGAAYVFTRTGDVWSGPTQLLASDAHAWAVFGVSVAIDPDGDTLLIGAELGHVGATQYQGKAYVFSRAGNTWTEEAILVADDGVANQRFGSSVALVGDTALVGAYDSAGGSAYVFTRTNNTWSQQAKLVGSQTADDDQFGRSVALSATGHTAVVGAQQTREWTGAAYVFTGVDGDWQETAVLTASDREFNHQVGNSVAIVGDTVLAGAWTSRVGETTNQGSAYAYQLTLTEPVPQITVEPRQLALTVDEGEQASASLTIGNTGGGALSWSVSATDGVCEETTPVGWLSVDPEAGSTEPEATTPVTVTVDAAGLAAGEHTASLCIDSNDPANPVRSVPVTVTVEATSAPVLCDRTVSGVHVGPLNVDSGVTCLAAGTQVLGEVNVAGGAGLVATAAVVQGPVSALGADRVELSFTQVTGPVLVSGATAQVWLFGNQVTGSVTLVAGATAEPAVVGGNTVVGSLSCFANSPEPTNLGLVNTATAGAFGQCASL